MSRLTQAHDERGTRRCGAERSTQRQLQKQKSHPKKWKLVKIASFSALKGMQNAQKQHQKKRRNLIPIAEKPWLPEVQITGPTRTVSRCQSAVRDPWESLPGRRRLETEGGWLVDAERSVSKLRSQNWRTSQFSVEPKQDVRRWCDKMVIEQTLTQNLREGFSYCSVC